MQASYTYSSSIDTNPGQLNPDTASTGSLQAVDPINISTDRGPSQTNIPNNFKMNVVYYLPTVKSDNRFVKGFANGWWLSGVWTNLSGFNFTPALSSNRSRSGSNNSPAGLDRPDWTAGFSGTNITSGTSAGCLGVTPGTALGTHTNWYDPCAFSLQPDGFLGNVGRNSVVGPTFRNLDFSLVKDTGMRWLGEAGKVELRAEVFNVLNRANFALPNRTVFNGAVSDVTEPASGTAGQILSTVGSSRQIQLALKIMF